MKYDELIDKLRDVHAINVTPFREDGGIDYEGLEANVRFLIENGAKVVVPCGNTGEFYALTVEEAEVVTRFVVEKVGGRATVVAGIGYDLKTAERLALSAQDAGADAVMVHHPVHPYLMTEGLVQYYEAIAKSVDVGVALYVRDAAINAEVLGRVTAMDNVVAVKYAVNDLPLFGSILQAVDSPVAWICGSAEMWAPFFFAVGAEGFTSGLVNLAPEKSLTMFEGLKRRDRDLVRDVWNEVAPLERLRSRHHNGNNVTVIKAGMNLMGLPGGRVREPISQLDGEDERELASILEAWGKI